MSNRRNSLEIQSAPIFLNPSRQEISELLGCEVGFDSNLVAQLVYQLFKNLDKEAFLATQPKEKVIEYIYLDKLLKLKYKSKIGKLPISESQIEFILLTLAKSKGYKELFAKSKGSTEKITVASRTISSLQLILVSLLCWGGLEKQVGSAKVADPKELTKIFIGLFRVEVSRLPKESTVINKGLPQITVGMELEYFNNLNLTLKDYFARVDLSVDGGKHLSWLQTFLGKYINLIDFGIFGITREKNGEYCYSIQDYQKTAFLAYPDKIRLVKNVNGGNCDEVVSLPSLHPGLCFSDLRHVMETEISNGRGSVHFRFLGFNFSGKVLYATEGLVFMLGGGLTPQIRNKGDMLIERIRKPSIKFTSETGKISMEYIPFHRDESGDSKLTKYPHENCNLRGFELRSLPAFYTVDEFRLYEKCVHFEYFIVQGAIALASKKRTSTQENLACVFQQFLKYRDEVMHSFGITVPSLEERIIGKSGTVLETVITRDEIIKNKYTIYLSKVKTLSESNQSFRKGLHQIINWYLLEAQKATGVQL